MDLKVILLVTFASLAQAKDDTFVDDITLGDFKEHLNKHFGKTKECFENIENEYCKKIEEFRNETEKQATISRQISLQGFGSYATAGTKALKEMHKIAAMMHIYATYIRQNFQSGKNEVVKEYAKLIKPEIQKLYSEYKTYKQKYDKKSHKVARLFGSFENKFSYIRSSEKFFLDINKRFQECVKKGGNF